MGKSHPLELRERVVAFVEEGNTHRSSAARFRVSIKFVNDMVKLKHETGRLDPKPQGRRGHGKLAPVACWVRGQMAARPATTLDELRAALEREHGIMVHRSSVGGLLHRLGLSHKKRSAGQ
jgi:transposase